MASPACSIRHRLPKGAIHVATQTPGADFGGRRLSGECTWHTPNIERLRTALTSRAAEWKATLRREPHIARLVLQRLIEPPVLSRFGGLQWVRRVAILAHGGTPRRPVQR